MIELTIYVKHDKRGYRAVAKGKGFEDIMEEYGRSPDEARGALIRHLYLDGRLEGGVNLKLTSFEDINDLKYQLGD